MDSTIPTAVAAACRRARLPLLRFDYSGVRGSGGGKAYDGSQPFHPAAEPEVAPDPPWCSMLEVPSEPPPVQMRHAGRGGRGRGGRGGAALGPLDG